MTKLLFCLAAMTFLAGCESASETGPAPLAKHFMAEFYSVDPDAVRVEIFTETPQLTAILAQVDGHVCVMEMVQAPKGGSERFGWLVSSMKCDLEEKPN